MEVLQELLLLGLCPRFQEPAPAVGIARVLQHIATVFKISHEKQETGQTRRTTRHRRGKVLKARLPSVARTCRSCKTSVPRSSSRPSLHTTAKTARENRRNLTTTPSPRGAHDPSIRRAVLFSNKIPKLRLQQVATRLKRPRLLLRQHKQGGKEDTPTQPVDALPDTKCRLRATPAAIMQCQAQ